MRIVFIGPPGSGKTTLLRYLALTYGREHAPAVVTFIRENPYMQRLTEGLRGSTGVLLQGAQAIGEQTLSAGAGLLSRVGSLLGWVVLPVYFAFFLIVMPLVGLIETPTRMPGSITDDVLGRSKGATPR